MKNNEICGNSNVTVQKKDGEVVIKIIGDFDSSTTPSIQKCCKKIKENGDAGKIILDFARAVRVDTTAFACIINFIKEHIGSGTEIFVTNLHDPEERLMDILKVEKLIKVL
ncbi:MAG: STAS domain-containing protein [Candidatus Omnitrophota bacterium]